METILKYKCSVCGAETDWDELLEGEPLCVACWDIRAGVDNELAAYRRRYYQEHKDELAAYQRRYYQEHKDAEQ